MASTYSPNLRIELIATGEQSGTWGSTTNTNLGTLIETAISGYESVVVAGDQALTAANGTADQSRNMVIEFTGAIAANYNIFIPPAEKVYIFKNSTTSVTPYTLTISASTTLNGTTPTGGTTVTIPQGKTMIVFCDANNVKEALDRVNGNLSVGGNLAVGGTVSSSGNLSTTGSLTAASLTLTSTPLSVSNGGTGVTSITAGTIPRGNGTSPLSPASAADIVANIGATAVQNATNAVNATNATSATTATNIAGGDTNKIPYNTAAGTTSFMDAPTGGSQYLRYSGSAFEWGTLPASGVLSVTASAPLASSGGSNPNITFTGTLGATNGGTAQSTYATGDTLYASGANTLSKLTVGTTGQYLTVAGGVPTWGSAVSSFSAGTTGLTPNTTTTGAVTLAGTLAVANGGTGATTAAGARANLGAGTGNGTVTSVGITAGTGISVSGSPVTSSGSITVNNTGVTSVDSTAGAVTLSSLSAFARSLATNGYQKLPGGLIIQWGSFAYSSAITSTTFPISFTTIYTVVCSGQNPSSTGGGAGAYPNLISVSNTGFSVSALSSQSKYWWIAIGV